MGQMFHQNGHSDGAPALSLMGLPTLESLAPPTSSEGEKAAFILRLLRQAAIKSRQAKSRDFYSIRDVARHFAVPPTTVTRVYGQLKEEGLLASIWGSKTFIEPHEIDREIRVKAIVGLPVSLRSFSTLRNYRTFFMVMQDVLWKQGFATRLLFYDSEDIDSSNLAELFLAYRIDVAIWFSPSSKISNTESRLTDRGIRSIRIVDSAPTNGDVGYYMSRLDGLREGLGAWKRSGISSVILLLQSGRHSSSRERLLESCLADAGIYYKFETVGSSALRRSLAASPSKYMGIIFTSSHAVLEFASEGVKAFATLLDKNRVMFIEGAMDLPGMAPFASFDAIEFDWQPIARRIGIDLVSGTHAPPHERIIFEAKWCGRDSGRISPTNSTRAGYRTLS
jgi:hypothetical protein